jgi:outer membrane protein assembly factor BamB
VGAPASLFAYNSEAFLLKRRYRFLIDAALIVVVVSISLVILTREVPPGRNSASIPAPPQKTWKPSATFDAEANANFGVETDRTDNDRLAGKQPGADWPQFNGLHRDNKSLETGLLSTWPSGGPKRAWVSRGLGAGYSSVAVVNGVVYTMGNKGESEAVIALDAGTGEKIWSTPFARAAHLSAGDGPRSTPSVSAGAVYGLSGYGDLVCLDASSGAIRWKENILQEFGAQNGSWGMCESVLVDDNRVICSPGGDDATLVALDPATGNPLWKALTPEKDRPGYASAAVAEVGGVRQYVQFTGSGTVGIRADDGKFLWRENSAANSSANCSSPQVAGDLVFTSSSYGIGGALVKLTASHSTVTAKLVYRTHDMSSHHGDMVIVDGLLYGSSDPGVLTCLDLASGKVKWRNRSVGKGAVTYADGRIYLRSEEGPVVLVEATGAGYRELGRFEPPKGKGSSAWSHPVVAAGKLFLRDQDLLLCYDLKQPK